ncbi:MAG: hypothetical protein HY900_29465 [Deltaproteobacteria bacterium]|nr:hypothetical protein [Deltaproteobacteria bacterium]
MRRVVIRKPDLDTVVAAFVLGVEPGDELVVVPCRAGPEDLADPGVLCLECGGSGDVGRSNFDHHDLGRDDPPACVQAYASRAPADPGAAELVTYTAAVDLAGPLDRKTAWPSLSQLFSGLRMVPREPPFAFWAGLRLVGEVHRRGLSPYGPLPVAGEWTSYIEAKKAERARLTKAMVRALFFHTESGRRSGFVETDGIGGHGALRRAGCELCVVATPAREDGTRLYTISASQLRISALLPALSALEPGWGGPSHGTILGSPPAGSRLAPDAVIGVVKAEGGRKKNFAERHDSGRF